jgi:hypothetical protein
MKVKGLLALLIAAAVIFTLTSFSLPAAAGKVSQQAVQQTVAAFGIMVGDSNGNMRLDENVTRAQLAKILMMVSKKDEKSDALNSSFPDVPHTYWAAPYVAGAVSAGYFNGYPDGTFKPENNSKTEEVVKTLLAVLGYTSADYGAGYPQPQLSFADGLGLLKNVNAQAGAYITRRDVMYLVYNTLHAADKSGQPYALTLGYKLTNNGTVDISAVINEKTVGPIVVKNSAWYEGTGLHIDNACVFLNDRPSSLDAVTINCVVYYSADLNTIWAYSKKVTGTLDEVSPTRLSPTSIVVCGISYKLSTAASEASGSFRYDEPVTLLLARDGTVADIIETDMSEKSIGFVNNAGLGRFYKPELKFYDSYYVSMTTLDGNLIRLRVPYETDLYASRAVVCSYEDKKPVFSLLESNNSGMNGTFDSSSMKMGSYKLATDIRILDTDKGNVVSVSTDRLNGISFSPDDIIYYQNDGDKTITALILKGVTGDTSKYGILVESKYGRCQLRIGNKINIYRPSIEYNTLGPVCLTENKLVRSGYDVISVTPLTSLTNIKLDSDVTIITETGETRRLWDSVSVYQLTESGDYMPTTISAVSGMKLTAYYDKAEEDGGVIRIIVAQK